jgi:predicted ATPase
LHCNGQLIAEKVSGTVEFSGQRYVSKPYLSILETEALSPYSKAIRDSIVFLDPIAVDSLPVDAETAKQVLESKAPQKTVKRMLSEEKLDLARAGLLLLVLSSREKEYFLEIVRKAFDSLKILDISLRQWHSSVHIVARETIGDRVVDVPYPRFPDGLKCFMFLYGALVQAPRGATIMIEEPEVHLHVTAIHSVMNLFRRHVEDRKLQFLVSTHSPDLIEIAYPDEVVRVERTVSGASLYSRLSSEEGHEDTMRYLAGMPR